MNIELNVDRSRVVFDKNLKSRPVQKKQAKKDVKISTYSISTEQKIAMNSTPFRTDSLFDKALNSVHNEIDSFQLLTRFNPLKSDYDLMTASAKKRVARDFRNNLLLNTANNEFLGKWLAIGRLFLTERQYGYAKKVVRYSKDLHKKGLEVAI